MTAPNHALTGALIGLTVSNPWLALSLAFISHFALDAIPHYNPSETDMVKLFKSVQFVREFLLLGAGLCFVIVLLLVAGRPHNWVQAAFGAFLATSADLFWIPRFLRSRRTCVDTVGSHWFFKFHDRIQWMTGPRLKWLEAVWFMVFGSLLIGRIW